MSSRGRHARLGPRQWHQWRRAWDGKVHGFAELGEVTSVAACELIALTSRLTPPADADRRCPICLTALGHEPTARPAADPPAGPAAGHTTMGNLGARP